MLTMFADFVDGFRAIRFHTGTRAAVRDLPPEIRRDTGFPDSCTARMSVRGRRGACHERW